MKFRPSKRHNDEIPRLSLIAFIDVVLFILLYFPCTAAIAAVYNESGTRWTMFVAAWTTGLGYGLATIFYQGATWALHPASSMAWIGGIIVCFAVVLWSLRRYGAREDGGLPLPQQV